MRVGALLARATSGEALLRAWNEVRANAYAGGDPGAPVLAFESRALKSLSELAEALADGTYQPSALTRVTIPKPTGGSQDLAVGAVDDRLLERAVLEVLDPLVDPVLSPWSFAYRRGLGVRDAVRALTETRESGARWVMRTLANFTLTAEHGCRLDAVGRRAFLGAFERRMLTLVHHPGEGRRIAWRQALAAQARQLAAVLAERQPEYRPVIWR